MEKTDAVKKKFSELMWQWTKNYEREFSFDETGRYFHGIAEFTMEEVTKAFQDHASDAKYGLYWPNVPQLIGQIIKAREKPAIASWGQIVAGLHVNGVDYLVSDDPAAHEALAYIGGWENLAKVKSEWLGKEKPGFMDAYRLSVKGKLPKPKPVFKQQANNTNHGKGPSRKEMREFWKRSAKYCKATADKNKPQQDA